MAKIGVILSGCGVFDGSEIHEAVCTLLSLQQRGAGYRCLAPDRDFDVVDHRTHKPTGETRNVLTEAARIARGEIDDLAAVKGTDYDAFVLPGGFGAAKNLCTFAVDGPECDVDPEVERVLTEAHAAGRPVGFICIAPAVAARVFGEALNPKLTIGHDKGTASAIEQLGARHVEADATAIVTDAECGVVSTPAYMEAKGPAEVFTGVDKLVAQLLSMVNTPVSA